MAESRRAGGVLPPALALTAASSDQLLGLARELCDTFRLRDWELRLNAAFLPDLTATIRRFDGRGALARCLVESEVTLVLTSHPSEIRPSPVLAILAESPVGDQGAQIARQLQAISPKVGLDRPSVADEVRVLIAHFERVLIDGAIDHIRRIQSAVLEVYFEPLPFIPAVVRFHTWVGADRDGNPAVTPAATYQAGINMRKAIVQRYRTMLELITQAAGKCGSEVWAAWLCQCRQLLADPHLPLDVWQECLRDLQTREIPLAAAELVERFLIAQSLFGLHLATLEWRENSAIILLADHEIQHTPLGEVSMTTSELMDSLRALARLRAENGPAAVGALIISNCETSAAVFALERVARHCGVFDQGAIAIVPLLESIAALELAPRILEQLLEDPHMRDFYHANHDRIQVMLGYSDAAKDGGRCMADIAIEQAQADIAEVAARYGVVPVIFHGRGGSPGRGYTEIADAFAELHPALPPGILKQTEQGEVVANRYGHPRLAASSLDEWFQRCLEHGDHLGPTEPQRKIRKNIAVHAYRVYRALRDEPKFLDHLLLLTPLADVCQLPLSSRPAARVAVDGGTSLTLERLRAIPLNFAMSIAGIPLLAWYGTGSAVLGFLEREGISEFHTLCAQDPQMRISLNRAARGLMLSDVDEFGARVLSFASPAVQQFAEKILTEAARLREVCDVLGIPLPAMNQASLEDRQLGELVAVLLGQDVAASTELKATTFAAVAASLGMTG